MLAGKPTEKRLEGNCVCRWEDNIRTDLNEIAYNLFKSNFLISFFILLVSASYLVFTEAGFVFLILTIEYFDVILYLIHFC